MRGWRRKVDQSQRAVVRGLPGVGVTLLCAAVVAVLVVPGVFPPAERGGPRLPKVVPSPPSALASTTVPAGCTTSGSTITCTYRYTGHNVRSLAIPQGVQTVHMVMYGAVGGGAEATPGGHGAEVTGTVDVTQLAAAQGSGWDRTLDITVGGDGSGATNRTGGWPGGGSGAGGHYNGGGGGGWTGVTLAGGTVVAVAGAGAGAGGYGTHETPTGAGSGGQDGGSGTQGGSYTFIGISCNAGGNGGGGATQSGSGGGGSGRGCSAGTSGGSGSGRTGGNGGGGNGASGSGGGGGGGGGGYYGGGGGAGGGSTGSGGGGGGGSSGVAGRTWVTAVSYAGQSYTYAQVTLSWTLRSSTTTLSVTGSSTVPAGRTATLESTVSATGTAPTGTVTFKSSLGQTLCTSVGLSGGRATCTFPDTSTLGARSYQATYNGNAAFAAGTSNGVTIKTVQDTTTLGPVHPTTTGGFHLVAKVSPPPYATTSLTGGTVTFHERPYGSTITRTVACSTTLPSAAPAAAVTASCSYSSAVPGDAYTVTATFASWHDNAAGSSPPSKVTVTKVTPTVTLDLTSSDVTYGQTVTVRATVRGLPSSDTTPGGVTYKLSPSGLAITCTGPDQHNPASVTSSTGVATPCTFTPGSGGTATSQAVEAAFAGDSETNAATSSVSTIDVAKASSSTLVTVTPQGGVGAVGVPITLTATVTNASHTTVTPGGTVRFEKAGATVAGCTDVTAVKGVAACTSEPAPTTLTSVTFSAVYCQTASGSCTDWSSSTAPTVTYTPTRDPTKVTLSPGGTETNPGSATGGRPITATATVATTAGTAPVGGTVSFVENGKSITATGGGTCSSESVGATGKVTCTFVPIPGNLDTVVAAYTPSGTSLTQASTSTAAYFRVSGLPTTTAVTVAGPTGTALASGGTIPYGVLLTATATVASEGSPVTSGTVSFAVGGSPAASCTAQPVNHTGKATCALAYLGAGSQTVGGAFAYAGGTYANSTGSTSFTVSAAPTTTTVAVGPDVTTPGHVVVTVTVANTAPEATAPPTGAVAVSAGGTPIAGCTAVALVAGTGATATATCVTATPTGSTQYTAAFTPANGDLSSSTSSAVTFNPGAACSTTFKNVWDVAGGSFAFSVGGVLTSLDKLSVDLGTVAGNCTATLTVPFTGGTLKLFGDTLASSGSVSGYFEEAAGATEVCVTGGSLGLPSGWSLGSLTLSTAAKLCFTVTAVSGRSATLSGFVGGSLTVDGIGLPFGVPDASVTYDLTATFATGATPTLTLHVAPATTPSTTPYATVTMTVTRKTGAFTASGTLKLENIPFASTLGAAFTVTTGSSGSISGSVTVTVAATKTYAPVPGLTLKGISMTLAHKTGQTTFDAMATAILGYGSQQVTVSLTGAYAASKWTLTLAATRISPWTPFSGLTLTPTLAGTLVITTAGGHTVVSYDFEGGTVPHGGSGTPLSTWSPGGGVTLTIDCVAFAFGIAPTCGAGPTSTSPTDPTLALQGSLSFGGSGGVTAGFKGTIDLKSGAVTFSLDSTAGPLSVTPVTGLTLTLTTLKVSGKVGSFSVTGKATAVVTALGATAAHPLTVAISDHGGTLVVAVGGISLRSLGVPLTGFFAYASATVKTFVTGEATFGTVSLAKGFNGFAVYHPTAGVISVLQQVGFSLPSGDTVTFTASWTPKSAPTFTATLASPSSGFPFLTLPDGGSITGASLTYASSSLSLKVTGTIPIPGSAAASIHLQLTVGSGGTFSGSATVTGLTVFGQDVGLVGTIARSTKGTITATISTCQPTSTGCTKGPIAGPFTPFAGVPFQLSTVSFSLGTGGLAVAATMTVDTLGSLKVTGTLTSLKTWSITVAAAAARSWSPVPDVTFSPSFTGTVTDAAGTVTFSLRASGIGGAPLFTLSPTGVTLKVTSVGLGNAPPPKGCTVKKVGDLWLTVNGSLGVSFDGISGTVAATGCFDLTAGSFTVTAKITRLSFSALTGHLTFGAPTVVISEATGKYQVNLNATLTVTMPTGGTLVVQAVLDIESGGNIVIGAEANLSQWLGSEGDTVYLYYSSTTVTGFNTGDPTLGKVNLVSGLNFALAITLPTTVISGLSHIGIDLPANTALTALGTANFTTDTYELTISIKLGTGGLQLFTSDGTAMYLVTGFLQVKLAPSFVQFSVGLTGRLHVAPPTSSATASTVKLTGELSVSTSGINVSLSLGTCKGSTPGWTNAFGLSGLTVKCAALTGGITYEFPFFDLGLSGTITSLPSVVANPIGYQDGAKISFAFNLDPFLLSLSIGTKGSTTPALEPLSYFGQGTLIKVYYASLYVSPTGATIGPTHYAAGISLGFQATLFHVNVSITATIGISPPSIHFSATISKITVGGVLSIGPVSVLLTVSPSNFEFQFTGTATLGPGSVKIVTDLKVGGKLSVTVQVELSKSGFSAFIWGTLSLTVTVYVATATCYTDGIWPYGCHWEWEHTGFSLTLGKTGFSVTSTGITLEADGYSVTFDYNGHVSVSAAYVRRAGSGGGVRGQLTVLHTSGHQHHRKSVPVALAATEQPLPSSRPTEHPLPPTTGPPPTPTVGQAVLVPTPAPGTASGSSGTSSGSGASSATSGTSSGSGSSAIGVAPIGSGQVVGSWTPVSSMGQGRALAAVATLHDGDVLVAGGVGSNKAVLSSAEVYDPATKDWTDVGTLAVARAGATATVLKDGDVLVAGGLGADHSPLASAELYDPTAGTFSATGSLQTARGFAASATLADGDVLVVGGTGTGHVPLASAELYDPSTGRFAPTGSLSTARAFAAVTALPGGGVLAAGGSGSNGALATAERYDPSTGQWTSAGTMSQSRVMASAVTLSDGDALVVGSGADGDLYDPSTGAWTTTEGMGVVTTMPTVAALPNGEVLVAGGESNGSSVASAELYQPKTTAWADAGTMQSPRSGAAAAVLSDGQVLVAGGGNIVGTPGQRPTITTEVSAEVYSAPMATGKRPTAPVGAPPSVPPSVPAVVRPTGLTGAPLVATVVGGVVLAAVLAAGVVEVRRRRRRPAVPDPE